MLNALIVDDEPFIRKGIINKIDWNRLGLELPGEANDAFEALDYIREKSVDIIVTDIKMPEMDGLSFIENARKMFGDRHHFIIISGYGEFEYACKAIKFGVNDYLLKPVNADEFRQLIEKLVLEINSMSREKKYRSFLEQNYRRNSNIQKDKLLSGLLVKNIGENLINENLKSLGIEFKHHKFTAAILKVDMIEYENSDFVEADEELILFSIRNILEDVFSACAGCSIFGNIRSEKEFIIIVNTQDDSNREAVKKLGQDAVRNILKYLKTGTTIGIGRLCNGRGEIYKSYGQAIFAAREKILKGVCRVYAFEDIQQSGSEIELLNDDYKKLFVKNLQESRKEDVIKLIEHLFEKKFNDRFFYNHSSVFELCMELYIFLSRYLKQNGKSINEFFGEKYDFIDEMMDLASMEEASNWLKAVCISAMDYALKDRRLTGEEIVQEVKSYINRNYSENITLSFIAKKYFIHPNYFCRIFRNIVGDSFTEYLTGIRMQKAKALLAVSNLQLNKICELVGYDDPRYFSQVFKKYFGISPSDYLTGITTAEQEADK